MEDEMDGFFEAREAYLERLEQDIDPEEPNFQDFFEEDYPELATLIH